MRKITRIVATRCQIFGVKCTKFDFGWSSAPDPIIPYGQFTALLLLIPWLHLRQGLK